MKPVWFFLLSVLLVSGINGIVPGVRAEDPIETDEDIETEVEVDGPEDVLSTEDSDDDPTSKASPEGETTLLFIKPRPETGKQLELTAGKIVEFLIGFKNKGSQDFLLESIDASFRYPMDFNFYIQNFSAVAYNTEVKSGNEATLAYSFLPAEAFAGRPFGLNVNLNYRDASGASFIDAVFNETIQVIEFEEGFDGETFFLYVLFAGLVVLAGIGAQQFFSTSKGKKGTKRVVVETGTTNRNDVDLDWIPKNIVQAATKSPQMRKSLQSPKQNKTKPSPKPLAQSPKASKQIQKSPQPRPTKKVNGTDK